MVYETQDHPQVATTLANIAFQYSNLGEFQKALKKFEHVLGNNLVGNFNQTQRINFLFYLEIEINVYKTLEHQQVATTLYQIARQLSRMGDYQKALEKFQQVHGKAASYK